MGITERKEREKLQRRNDIIDAAERVFFSKGIDHATMDDIAEEAEYSKGTLYLYFKNKEELQYAIKIRASELLKKSFSKAVKSDLTGIENVENIGRSFILFSRQHPDYFNLLMLFEGKSLENLDFDNPFIKKFFEEDSPLILFRGIIEGGQQDGTIRDDLSSDVIAHELWAMTTGVLQLLTQQKMVLDACGFQGEESDFIEGLFAILKQGLKK